MGCEQEKLIKFLPWAQGFARSCTAKLPAYLDRDDLQSAGVLGYIRAASRYDAERGASFRGFCAVRIRGAVLDELRRWDWAPRSIHKHHRRITRITDRLIEELEREPTDLELAAALGLEVSELASFLTQSQPRQLVSFDEMTEYPHGDESLPLTERLADPHAANPDEALRSTENRRHMLQCLSLLPKSQATVIVLYYFQNVPLRDVAEVLAVTPSRVSQLHHEALRRLKQTFRRAQFLT